MTQITGTIVGVELSGRGIQYVTVDAKPGTRGILLSFVGNDRLFGAVEGDRVVLTIVDEEWKLLSKLSGDSRD